VLLCREKLRLSGALPFPHEATPRLLLPQLLPEQPLLEQLGLFAETCQKPNRKGDGRRSLANGDCRISVRVRLGELKLAAIHSNHADELRPRQRVRSLPVLAWYAQRPLSDTSARNIPAQRMGREGFEPSTLGLRVRPDKPQRTASLGNPLQRGGS